MDFDFPERLFGRFWRRVRPAKPDRQAHRAWFDQRVAHSEAVASMWAGRRVLVREAEHLGGVRAAVVLMPRLECLPGGDEAAREQFWQTRLVHAAEMIREGGRSEAMDLGAVAGAWRGAVRHLLAAREAEERLGVASPEWTRRAKEARRAQLRQAVSVDPRTRDGAEQAWHELAQAFFRGELDPAGLVQRAAALPSCSASFVDPGLALWGGALFSSEAQAADRAAAEWAAQEQSSEAGVEEGASEMPARPRDFLRRTALEDDPDKDVMPEHVFEKIETLEEHVGGRRRPDGEDELADHADALEELDLRELVRGGPEAESVYQLELDAWEGVPEVGELLPGESGVQYDEWDAGRARYRRDWVTVYPSQPPAPLPGWGAAIRREQRQVRQRLIRQLKVRRERREMQRRVLEGSEVDLGEYLIERAAMRAGRASDGRVYRHRRPRRRDLACSILLDISLSSDSWVQDRRVLDATRAATVLVGDLAEELGDALKVQCFASQTRHRNRVWTLKDWGDSWSREADRLGTLRCQGYTRIGAALRHAAADLARVPARRRVLFVLTDGKPTDYDRYEGRYGRGDIRQVGREIARNGVRLHAIGFDPRVARHLGPMFGPGCWTSVDGPRALADGLAAAYRGFAS